ncbi:MAG: guanylate kinase [Acidobacteriota bacterium]
MIYVVSGPSGCGKSTLIHRVLADLEDVAFSVSHTSRPKRESEVEGRDYYFINPETFREMVRKDEFVEWAVVHGAYYGTSRKELEKGRTEDLVLDIDVQGARQVKEKIKTAVFIFILPPSRRELERRIRSRGLDSPAAVRKRLAAAQKEVRAYSRFDYVVVNDDLEEATRELGSIFSCRRAALRARKKTIAPILAGFRAKGGKKA